MKLYLKNIFVVIFLFFGVNFYAQEVLRITQTELDKRFLEKNYNLIASHANIDVNRAYKQQALLWDNPFFDAETALLTIPDNVHVLDFGQVYFQFQQLIRTAKKLKKNADISEATAQLSEAQFYDLTRTLRHQLHSDFNDLSTVYEKSVWNKMQIDSFTKLVNAVDNQVKVGNMAKKDLFLLQSQRIQLQRDAADLERSKIALQSDMQNLLGEKNEIVVIPVVSADEKIQQNTENLSVANLINTAIESRPDLKIARANVNIQEKNLIYQKALAVPDLTASLSYSKSGSYNNNYFGLNLGLPLPVFNKNQFNIKAAQLVINQQQNLQDAALVQISSDVINAYRRLEDLEKWRNGTSAKAYKDYEDFFNANVMSSYQTKQMTLVDFIVFYQNYQQNKIQQIDTDAQIRQAVENLNFVVGKKVR